MLVDDFVVYYRSSKSWTDDVSVRRFVDYQLGRESSRTANYCANL